MKPVTLEEIVSLLKRRGFVFQSSEIYGGWEAAYDFGPLGTELLRNLRSSWWTNFVHKQHNIVGLVAQLFLIRKYGKQVVMLNHLVM